MDIYSVIVLTFYRFILCYVLKLCSHGDLQPRQKDLHTLGLTVRGRAHPAASTMNMNMNMNTSMDSGFTGSTAPAPAAAQSVPMPQFSSGPRSSAEVAIPSVSREKENTRTTTNTNTNTSASAPAAPVVPAPGVVKGMIPDSGPRPADDFINRSELPGQLASTFDYIIGQLDMISTTVALFDQRMGLIEDNLAMLNGRARGSTALSPQRTVTAAAPAAPSAPRPAAAPVFDAGATAGMASALGLKGQIEQEVDEEFYGGEPDDEVGMDGIPDPDSEGEEEDYSQKFSEYASDSSDEDADDIEIK